MKIVHYIASIDENGGGTTEYMRLLSLYLSKYCDVTVVAGLSNNPIQIEGATVKLIDTSFKRWKGMQRDFEKLLTDIEPDIVHINGIWTPYNWLFQKVSQKLRVKVVLSPHGMLEPWIMSRNKLKKKLAMILYQNKAIKRADHLHITAKMEAENIFKLGYNNPATNIPNGVDLNEFGDIKRNYGTKRMIFISRIHPKKGIELLIEAWRQVETKGWVLEIAGNGEKTYIDTLKSSAKDLKNIEFVGAKYGENKWDFIRSADIMILPTHSENFGIVVVESLAVGVPVITTTGTPWEELNDRNCGWWIELNSKELEKTLKKSMQIPKDQLEELGKNGIDLIIEKYDIKVIAKEMNKMYKNILTIE